MEHATNPFENDGMFGYNRDTAVANHGADAMVHLKVGQCDIPEGLHVILDHQPGFEDWLERMGRIALAVSDESVGLYFLEDESPMVGTGCVIISKVKN